MSDGQSELRLTCPALPEHAKDVRHALGAFLSALDVEHERVADILTAVGETVLNVIEHAYAAADLPQPGAVEMYVVAEQERGLRVEVADRGRFIYRRRPRPGRGFGLRIVRAIARDVSVKASPSGTHVSMVFDVSERRQRAM